MKTKIYKLNKKVEKLAITTYKLSAANEMLLKAQELLDKASARLALIAAKLHHMSESINPKRETGILHIEDLWEVEVLFQDTKGSIDTIRVKNTKTKEKFEAVRFDRYTHNFINKRFPLISPEGRMLIAQALKLFLTQDLGYDKIGVLN
jgi:chromosome segregation ATPase